MGKKKLIVLVTKGFGLFEKLEIGKRGKIITILFSMLNYGQSSTSRWSIPPGTHIFCLEYYKLAQTNVGIKIHIL